MTANRGASLGVAMTVALAACGQSAEPRPFTDLGALAKPETVTARDGGASVLVGGRVLWMFGDTLMTVTAADGFNYRSATAAWGSVAAPTAIDETLESTGAPSQLFPYAPDEAAYNAAHGPMERYGLWPGSAIAAPDGSGGAWLFYQRLLIHPGDLNYQGLDVGLARLAPGSTVAARDPAPLFTAPTPAYTLAALVDGGFVYLYAADAVPGQLDSLCRLVRAPLDGAPDPSVWSAWDGTGWNSDLGRAATVLHGPPGDLSVSYNSARSAFLAVYSGIFSNDVVFRTAPRPEGPWSDARTLFQGVAAASGNDYAGKEHPELAAGAQVVVSYARGTGPFAGEVRLAQVALPAP